MTRSTKTWPVLQPQPSQHQHNSCERDHRVHFSVDRAVVLTWFRSLSVSFTSKFKWRHSAGVMQNVSNQAAHTGANLGEVSHSSSDAHCCFVCTLHTDVCNIEGKTSSRKTWTSPVTHRDLTSDNYNLDDWEPTQTYMQIIFKISKLHFKNVLMQQN